MVVIVKPTTGEAMMRRGSPSGSGWRSMESAPRDGTVVELCCTYGIAPWYGLHRWTNRRMLSCRRQMADGSIVIEPPTESIGEYAWVKDGDDSSGVGGLGEGTLYWRPTAQRAAAYVDPTAGAQDSSDYWIRASGLNPSDYPNRPNPALTAEPAKRSFFARLFA